MKAIATSIYWGCLAMFWYHMLKGRPARRESKQCSKEADEVLTKMESLLAERSHPSRARVDNTTLRDEYDALKIRWNAIDDRWQASLQEQKLWNHRGWMWFLPGLVFYVIIVFVL